jgi:hypothetical protein
MHRAPVNRRRLNERGSASKMDDVLDGSEKYDSDPAQEILQLAGRMFEDDWTDEERERLDALISTSDEACRVYLDFVVMQFALYRLNTAADGAATACGELEDDLPYAPAKSSEESCPTDAPIAVGPDAVLPAQLASHKQSGRYLTRRARAWHRETWAAAGLLLGVATTLLCLGLNGMLQWQGQPRSSAALVQTDDPHAKIHFAVMTKSVNCQWSGAVPAGLTSGADLGETPQILTLTYGLAQFSLGTDAEAVIEGPAKLSFRDHDAIELIEGKLAVTLAEGGKPVRILTPYGSVQVPPGGVVSAEVTTNLEVQSVRNDAEVTWTTPHEVLHQHVVVAGAALRIDPWERNGQVTNISFDETRFITDLSLPFESAALPELPVQRDLVLWYSADRNARIDRQNRVVCWGDTLVGDNSVADNCWQPLESRRPRIVDNAINGRPAIRFDDRHQSLVSSEVALPDEQTIAMVFCARTPSQASGVEWQNRHPDSAVVTLVGPPGIVLGTDRETKVAQLTVGTRVQSGRTKGPMNFLFRRAERIVDVDTPVAATIVYSAASRKVRVFLNGQLVIDAPAEPGVASDRTNLCLAMNESGTSPFFGDVAEYIHFRRALSSDELDDLHRYLSDRYSLEMAAEGSSASP